MTENWWPLLIFIGAGLMLFLLARRIKKPFDLRARRTIDEFTQQTTIVPPPPAHISESAVRSRRAFLQEVLGERSDPPRYEILEVPGDFPKAPRRELSEAQAHAQSVVLRWQLKSDSYLLVGRVMDAILSLSRLRDIAPGQLASRIRLTERDDGAYPFQAAISTRRKDLLQTELFPIGEWLGIGIVAEPPVVVEEFAFRGSCAQPGGKPGCFGGALRIEHLSCNDHFLTCSHVISRSCGMAFARADLSVTDTREPDFALLCRQGGCACFPFGGWKGGREIAVQPSDDLALRAVGTVRRIPGRSPTGRIHGSSVQWVEYQGRVHQFPHVQIQAEVSKVMDLVYWPPRDARFSRRGDSGSWVVTDTGDWLGMIVGGDKFGTTSYAVLAEPLLELLTAQMATAGPGPAIQPLVRS